MQPYSLEKEERMRSFYESLNEKDRRRFAGFEALQYGHGAGIILLVSWDAAGTR